MYNQTARTVTDCLEDTVEIANNIQHSAKVLPPTPYFFFFFCTDFVIDIYVRKSALLGYYKSILDFQKKENVSKNVCQKESSILH